MNPRLANLVTRYLESKGIDRIVPLVGCAAHRLNLGVKTYYEDPKNPDGPKSLYSEHIKAVNKLMVDLMSLKNRAKLSVVTDKVPIRLHEIRWAGARNLALRYNEIKNDMRSASLPLETRKLFLNAEMEEGIDEFLGILNDCHDVSLYLQNSNGEECTMMGTRNLFDALIKKFPSMRDDIKPNSRHVHCPDFENGIVKIQSHQEAKLSAAEKEAVKVFLIEEVEREEPANELSFVQSVLMEAEEQQKKRSRVSKYRSTAHVTPVSCIC